METDFGCVSGGFLRSFFQTLVLRFARGHVEARRPHGALQGELTAVVYIWGFAGDERLVNGIV